MKNFLTMALIITITICVALLFVKWVNFVMKQQDNVWCANQVSMHINNGMNSLHKDFPMVCTEYKTLTVDGNILLDYNMNK